MKSRLTIEVDFDNCNKPIILAKVYHTSDDIRDKLLLSFFQALRGGKDCDAQCIQNNGPDVDSFNDIFSLWKITPVTWIPNGKVAETPEDIESGIIQRINEGIIEFIEDRQLDGTISKQTAAKLQSKFASS